jgi:hypothetical protein
MYAIREFSENAYGGSYDASDFTLAYTGTMAQYKPNVIRFAVSNHESQNGAQNVVSPRPYNRSGTCCADDGGNKWDLTSFNVGNLTTPSMTSSAFFERIRARALNARNNGIWTALLVFNSWQWDARWANLPWPRDEFHSSNNVNSVNGDQDGNGDGLDLGTQHANFLSHQQAYVNKLVEAVCDIDSMLWEINNEMYDTSSYNTGQNYWAGYIKARLASQGCYAHPVGVSSTAAGDGSPSTSYMADAVAMNNVDFVTPNGIDQIATPTKHVWDGKVWIQDWDHTDPCGIGTADSKGPWRQAMRGQNIWFIYQHCSGGTIGTPNGTEAAIMKQMANAKTYMDRMDLRTVAPNDNSGECSSTYCLFGANDVIGYLPNGGSLTVNQIPSGNWTCEWFRTSDGALGTCNGFTSAGIGQSRTFTNPFGSSPSVMYARLATVSPPPPPPPGPNPPPPPPPTPPNRPTNLRVN